MKKLLTAHLVLALTVLLLSPLNAAAQENKRPELVERIFTISYADLSTIHDLARRFASEWGVITVDPQSKTIIVRDTRDAIERIATKIASIDVPPDQLRLTFFVFQASKTEGGQQKDELPKGVTSALDEVKKLMAYKSFSLIDSGLLTMVSTADAGDLRVSENIAISFHMDYHRESKYLRLDNLTLFKEDEDKKLRQLFRTDVALGNGEVVVAGASKLDGGDTALLTIVTMDVKSLQGK